MTVLQSILPSRRLMYSVFVVIFSENITGNAVVIFRDVFNIQSVLFDVKVVDKINR